MTESMNRRKFIASTALAGAGLSFAGHLSSVRGANAPNNKVVVAVMGVNGRGHAIAESFAKTEGAEVGFICDVDEQAMANSVTNIGKIQDKTPGGVKDFRTLLEGSDIDALVIAAPDHWHAPAAIMAMQAGKDVYVEKPCGHNPLEGELLIEAQRKYNRVVQMGTQQRSAPESIELIQLIREGIIGRPYYGKSWYSNTRGSIGTGKLTTVPAHLDFELWRGPAPRRPYQDNLIHYNWHWFTLYGTGESCNNGTHEIDVCRWALGVDYPVRVTSAGGRYHYNDDWEFYDTQVASFDFDGEKTISWEGRSCNGLEHYGRGRGATIHGTEGTALVDREGYIIYDLKNEEIRKKTRESSVDALNTVGGDALTDIHVANFISGIQNGTPLNTPIWEGHKSVLLCHLANIAQRVGRTLQTNASNGHIINDQEAMAFWSRAYEPGWEPVV